MTQDPFTLVGIRPEEKRTVTARKKTERRQGDV